MDKLIKTLLMTNKFNITINFLNSHDLTKRVLYLGTEYNLTIEKVRDH